MSAHVLAARGEQDVAREAHGEGRRDGVGGQLGPDDDVFAGPAGQRRREGTVGELRVGDLVPVDDPPAHLDGKRLTFDDPAVEIGETGDALGRRISCQHHITRLGLALAQAHHLRIVGADPQPRVYAEAGTLEQPRVELEFDPVGADGPHVLELAPRESLRGDGADEHERVGGLLIEVGEGGRESVVQPRGIEAELPLSGHLRSQIGIPQVERREGGRARVPCGRPRSHRVKGARSAAGLTVGRAQLDGAEAGIPEVLVADHPGAAHLGVDLETEPRTEGAVAVDPDPAGHEVLVADVEDVLDEEARVPDLLAVLLRHLDGRGTHRGLGCAGEILAQQS